ncbi:MAG: hypothetical protein GTO41_06305 [Burkholderiales bacterium]|nr:hypothetical protein [Burkholderiales bacterium]
MKRESFAELNFFRDELGNRGGGIAHHYRQAVDFSIRAVSSELGVELINKSQPLLGADRCFYNGFVLA